MQVSKYKKEPFTPSPALPHRFPDTSQPICLFQSRKKTFGKQDQTQREETALCFTIQGKLCHQLCKPPIPCGTQTMGQFHLPCSTNSPRGNPFAQQTLHKAANPPRGVREGAQGKHLKFILKEFSCSRDPGWDCPSNPSGHLGPAATRASLPSRASSSYCSPEHTR